MSGMIHARGSGWVVVLFTKMGQLEVAWVCGERSRDLSMLNLRGL